MHNAAGFLSFRGVAKMQDGRVIPSLLRIPTLPLQHTYTPFISVMHLLLRWLPLWPVILVSAKLNLKTIKHMIIKASKRRLALVSPEREARAFIWSVGHPELLTQYDCWGLNYGLMQGMIVESLGNFLLRVWECWKDYNMEDCRCFHAMLCLVPVLKINRLSENRRGPEVGMENSWYQRKTLHGAK